MTKRPIIGVTLDAEQPGGYSKYPWYAIRQNYADAIAAAGGLPIALPHDAALAAEYLDRIDALVVTGGAFDVDPSLYGDADRHATVTLKENRTAAELALTNGALARNMPVLGIWDAFAPPGSAAVGASPGLNGNAPGESWLQVTSNGDDVVRLGIADMRGDGRPDYNFGARVLYADTVSPANVSAAGGLVTITGTGFRPGNTVTVDGVAATVQSWTATQIIATVPTSHALGHGTAAITADVAVTDPSTGGTTVMSQALSYAAAAAENMQLIS